jgi:hypothetical protein
LYSLGGSRTCAKEDKMTIKIIPNDKGNPPGKLADVELHFTSGPLEGLKLTGFGVWDSVAFVEEPRHEVLRCFGRRVCKPRAAPPQYMRGTQEDSFEEVLRCGDITLSFGRLGASEQEGTSGIFCKQLKHGA